jgi:hypothetical protein
MKKPKFYTLDLTGCKDEDLGSLAGKLSKILCMDPQYCGGGGYDVVEEELPVDICNLIRHETPEVKAHTQRWADIDGALEDMDWMPVYFKTIPKGAALTEVK